MIKTNYLKEKLEKGESVIGTWSIIPSTITTDIIASTGVDFIIIDAEHGPISFETAQNMAMVCESRNVSPVMRVGTINEADILKALDIGVHCIQIPNINTKEDVEKIIQFAKYPPIGERGFSPFTRAGEYSINNSKTLTEKANKNTLIAINIEGKEAIEDIDNILKIEHLDIIFVGLFDLSKALGIPGDVENPKVLEYIDKLPNLKAIVRYGVGYDAIDLSYAKSKNIYVCNTPDYGTEEVSDTAIAMIMNIARGISRYDYQCRNYKDNTWQENTLSNIRRNSDYHLGVIGAGRIGGSVLLKAKNLRFNTSFYDPYVPRGHEKMLDSKRYDTINELLETCDIISINCPLSTETEGMIDEKFISNMKDGASLINTARGGIIKDIDVFYEPLKNNKLSNISLDVIPHEPPKNSKLINAWENREPWLDGRFILNPHTAYYSDKAYFEMREKAALNALRIINGKEPYNIVN